MMSEQWMQLRAELDEMSQTLFGALASLDAHMRRLRRPDSPSNMELGFAIQHIRSVQHRLIELAQRPMP